MKISELSLSLKSSWIFPYLLAFKEFLRGQRTIDFTQFGEQEIIASLVPEKGGSYLDIGAGRPVSGNNTFFLYKKGWSGVLVDPIKANTISSRHVRRRDTCINALVSTFEKITFFEFFPYEFSTTRDSIAKKVSEEIPFAKLVGQYDVIGVSAASLFQKLPQSHFVFLNIDTEGSDYEVLISLDLAVNKPDLICIEEWDFKGSNVTISGELLSRHGYTLVARAGLSSFYMK